MSTSSSSAKLHQELNILPLASNQPVAVERISKGNTGLVYVLIDHSNVYVEGKFIVGALERIYDRSRNTYYMKQLTIDFGCFLTALQRNRKLGNNPIIVGPRPSTNDSLWKTIREQEYKVTIYDRISVNKEVRVDTKITVSMVINSLVKIKNPGILILAAGDGDYVPALEEIMKAGWKVEIRFWTLSTSRHLKNLKVGELKTTFIPLDSEYKSFTFGFGPEPTKRKKVLEITHNKDKTLENKDLLKCYVGIRSFCWWHKVNNGILQMYFNTNADLKMANRWLVKNFMEIQVWQKS
ncbi:4749_t:CDS:2 [Funneliformis geosporum]|uniref:9448_t:CDS:1 n=1 Tax=Funneliformis geosporum TaxID=1117311 RepID=A0A9W4SWY6_9GLOM|nr:9448_t:CDS:2 [Funneliformis geosporum]CAI2186822.1 4749_t:CDS:2 [Funneliformis geosporum]